MPSNAPAMRKAGPITSAGWPRLQPGATRARTPGTAALAGSDCFPLSISPHLSLLQFHGERRLAGVSTAASSRIGPYRSALLVLVVTAPPDARLVAPLGGSVEPLVHAPEAVQSARIGGIGVVDDAVLEHERAHARPLARVRGHVGSGHGRDLGDGPLLPRRGVAPDQRRARLAPVVVFDASFALLLLGEADVEVEVEIAAERGRPGKRPPHPPLVRLQLRERRPRHRRKRDVVVGQVDDEAVEAVRDRRAGRTPRRVVGPEHEVVDEELRAPSEEVCQRGAPLVDLKSILLVDPDPRQLLPPPRQLVAAPCELLLRLEQLDPRCEPLLPCPGHVLRHRSSLLLRVSFSVRALPSRVRSTSCGGITSWREGYPSPWPQGHYHGESGHALTAACTGGTRLCDLFSARAGPAAASETGGAITLSFAAHRSVPVMR